MEDCPALLEEGVHAAGLVFYAKSPRLVSVERAAAISRALPPFIVRVALFVDAPAEAIRRVLQEVEIDLLQFHGDEPPARCESFGLPYIKAVRMNARTSLERVAADYASARALLLDADIAGRAGGTGRGFDWGLLPARPPKPLILAGGLNADNVAAAITQVRPYAVDVSSGVECRAGRKDAGRIADFMAAVRETDAGRRP